MTIDNSNIIAAATSAVKSPSSKLINLIAEANFTIESAKDKILVAYRYAIDVDKYTPQEAHDILKERLFFSKRYIREVLPLEAKHIEKTRKGIDQEEEGGGGEQEEKEDEEHVPHTTAGGTISALEEFRQQRGKQVVATEEDDLSARIPDDRDLTPISTMQEEAEWNRGGGGEHDLHAIEIKRHQEVIKHLNERIDYLVTKFEVSVSIDFHDMVLPIILIVDPGEKIVRWRPDEEEIERLQAEENKKMVT